MSLGQKEEQIHTFVKGINKDLSYLSVPNEFMTDCLNAVLTSDNTDYFTFNNERGTLPAANLPANKTCIGFYIMEDQEVLFFVSNLGISPIESEIGVVTNNVYQTYITSNGTTTTSYNIVNTNGPYQTWNDSSGFSFSLNNPIKVRWRKAFNNHRIIYFTDNVNSPRFLDLDNIIYPTTVDPNPSIANVTSLFDIQELPIITYNSTINSGSLHVGSYQFIVQYLDSNLNPSVFSNATPPIPVVAALRSNGRSEYTGNTLGTVAGKSIVLDITNIDTAFPYLQLIAVSYQGSSETVVANVVSRQTITGTTMQVIFSNDSTSISTIDLTSLVTDTNTYLTAKAIETKDNVLSFGNLTSIPNSNLQQVANQISMKYIIKEIPYVDVYPSSKQVPNIVSTSLQFLGAVVQSSAVDTIILQFNKNISPTVVLTDVALIKMEVAVGTPNITSFTRLTPSTLTVNGSSINVQFSGNDFTNTSLFNFSDLTTLLTSDPAFVPLYFIAFGTYVSAPAGGAVGNSITAVDTTTIDYINPVYSGVTTFTSMTATNPSVLTLPSSRPEIMVGSLLAIYGSTQTSEGNGYFPVTSIVTPSTVFDVTPFTVIADSVGGPVFTVTTIDIIAISQSNVNSGNVLDNEFYFADYKDEGMCAEYKSRKRGEAYAIGIRFIYTNGSKSSFFHIPGNNRTAIYNTANNEINRLGAIPDINTYPGRKDQSSGMCGTFVSALTYNSAGLPTDGGTGYNYSAGGNIRHHIMPSIDQEPITRFDLPTQSYILRLLGTLPIWINNGQQLTIADLIVASNLPNVEGYEIGFQDRTLPENQYVIMQGISQQLNFHTSTTTNGPANLGFTRISNSLFQGKTSIVTGTRVYGLCEDGSNNYGFNSINSNYNIPYLAQFYSPDITLLQKTIPAGASIKVVGCLEGDCSTVYMSEPQFSSSESKSQSGIVHLFYNYTDYIDPAVYRAYTGVPILQDTANLLDTNKQSTPYTGPVPIQNSFQASYTQYYESYGASVIPNYPSLQMGNYLNEGYTCLDFGVNSGLPDFTSAQPGSNNGQDFYINIAANQYQTGIIGTNNNFNTYYYISSWTSFSQNFHTNRVQRLIYDIVTENPVQYGNIEGASYIVCESFPDYTKANTLKTSQLFNGDIFISKCSFRNSGAFPTAIRSGNSHYVDTANARVSGSGSFIGEEYRCLFWLFFESIVNCNYRHTGVDTSGNSLTAPFPVNNLLSYGSVINTSIFFSYNSGNPTGTREIPFANTGKGTSTAGAIDTPPNISEASQYNNLYSVQDIINVGFSTSLAFTDVSEYPNRIIYSATAVEGEVQDSYRKFLTNNYHDIPKDKGPINILFKFGNDYYIHTKYSLFKAYYNENVEIPASTGTVYLGSGGIFNRPSVEVMTINGGYAGCESEWASVNTPDRRYFIDTVQGKLFMIGEGGLREVSHNLLRFFLSNFKYSDYTDNPFTNNGLISSYDYNLNRFILTDGKENTLSFYPQIENFFSFHSYIPSVIYSKGTTVRMINTSSPILYSLGQGNYGNYFGNQFSTQLEVSVNEAVLFDKVFDNIVAKATVYDDANNTIRHQDFFDEYQVINDISNSSLLPLTPNVSYKYKRDGFNLSYPRSATINPYNDVEDPANINTNVLFLPRIKGKYARLRFVYQNLNNYRLNVNNIVSLFRYVAR